MKVGDTLYRIYTIDEELARGGDELTYTPRVEAVVAEEVFLSEHASWVTVRAKEPNRHLRYALSDVEKYLYRSKEEAERALKEVWKQ